MAKDILYIIPNKGVGGVERLFEDLSNSEQLANVEFLFISESKQSLLPYTISLLKICRTVYLKRPRVVIGSLWRVHFGMIILHAFREFTYIPFYHSERSRSWIDGVISYLVYKKSSLILYDSVATARRYDNIGKDKRVLSLFMSNVKHKKIITDPHKLSFVYVGRIAKVKNIEESLSFLRNYSSLIGREITFDIYGPLEYDLNLEDYPFARLCGVLAQDRVMDVIIDYDIFLQTSNVEGFAMTAKESLRAGQFCILKAVGDLANYKNEEIFLTFDSVVETAARLKDLTQPEIIKYQEKAKQKFSGVNTIIDDFKLITNEFTLPKL